ncbi:hypothetical protein BGZ88_000113 [Linnemannia elongata]|nr:hypothetical protein BGZ88_000113 [Linnemannia elongata]
MTRYIRHSWRLGLLAALLLCLLWRVTAEDPLVLPPSSPITEPNTSEPDGPDLPPAIQPSSLPLPPTQPEALPPPLPPPPSHLTPIISTHSPASQPTTSTTARSQTKPTPTKTTETPTAKQKEDEKPRNRAAITLNLVHVPLKTSCEILRKFYNSSGGVNWSNQDGWQYVDSVRIPISSPRGQFRGDDNRVMPGSDLRRRTQRSGFKRDKYPPPENSDDDNDFVPPLPQRPTKKSPPSTSSRQSPPAYDYDDSDPLQGSLFNPSPTLDPDNCCGWFGVVCIGPDGVVPPPWPPYDEDLVSSRYTVATATTHRPRTEQQDQVPHLSKRIPPPYYHHDRNPHRGGHGRHGGHGHSTGGTDNRHQPNDDNNENGQSPDEGYNDNGQNPDDGYNDDGHDEDDDIYDDHGDLRTHNPVKPGPRGHVKDDWYIIELHLGYNGLTGPVPEELSELVNLLILDLSNNDLTGTIPESYSKLSRLRRLDLSSNQITGEFPVAVTKMVNIQELVIKNNYMQGSLPKEVMKLKQLTELSIANNDFDGLLPEGLFTSLTKLRVININQNGFTGDIAGEIGALAGLLRFSARANEFKGRIPKEFGSCKQLQFLSLADNHFSGELPDALFDLQNLKVLDLPDNKLTGNLSPRIGNMISLTRLILAHNEFTGPLPVELQNLTRMEYMVINYNQFDGLFPIATAPTLMGVCLVQPNEFSACPPNSSVETSTTLAYRCNLDCRDRVIHPEKYDEFSGAAGSLALQWSMLVVFLTTIITILQFL